MTDTPRWRQLLAGQPDHSEHLHVAPGGGRFDGPLARLGGMVAGMGPFTRSALVDPPSGSSPGELQGLPEMQTRTVQHLELRVAAEDEGTFDGYACLWDVTDSYGTSFRKGAFVAGGLDQSAYALLWMHYPEQVLGTFYASEDERGLRIVGRYDDTPEGQTGRTRARSGSAAELSVGFVPVGTAPDDDNAFSVCRLVETSQITARMAAVPGAGLVGVRQAPRVPDEAADRARRAGLALARLRLSLPPQGYDA